MNQGTILIDIKNTITSTINEILKDFGCFPSKYLTESDARCLLFNLLMQNDIFSELKPTADKDLSQSIPLHTEVRWYGDSGKLKYRSDIVIIEVSSLRVKEKMKLPSKGFSFNKFSAIIEIKLRRINGDPDKKFIEKIKADIKKLKNIKKKIDGVWDFIPFLLILDKKNNIQHSINSLSNKADSSNNLQIFYKSSK